MNLRILSVLLGLMGATSLRALSISTLSSDGDFLATYTPDVWTKAFGGNVRWGNNAANGDWESSVVSGTDAPLNQQQGPASGSRDFSFSFNSTLSKASSTLSKASLALSGISTSESVVPGTGINTVLIRARASDGKTATISNLTLDLGGSIYLLGDLIGDANASYIVLRDAAFAGDWTFRGTGLLQSVAPLRGSDPMYQFKVGTTASVPDAGASALLMLMGLGACAALRRARA